MYIIQIVFKYAGFYGTACSRCGHSNHDIIVDNEFANIYLLSSI